MHTATEAARHSSMDPAHTITGAPTRTIAIGDDEIAYWRVGTGPDLVLVHGWPLHAATFRNILPALAHHYTCHLFDLPGAGQTKSRTDAPVGFAEHAVTVAKLIDALGLDRYAMLAHDSGAAIARIVAAEHGDRVRAIVIGNTEIPGHHAPLVKLYCTAARIPGGAAVFQMLLRSRAVRRSSLGFGGCFADADYLDSDFHRIFVEPLLSSSTVFRGQMRLARGMDFSALDDFARVHARITAPVCFVWGALDPFFPLALARAMPAQFGGKAELCVIPDGKLFAHEDRPEAFLGHALPFLRAHVR